MATALGIPSGSAPRKPPVASGGAKNSLSTHSLSKESLSKESLSQGQAGVQGAEASLGCEADVVTKEGPVGRSEGSGSLSPVERVCREGVRRRSPFPEQSSSCDSPCGHSAGPRAMSRVTSNESSGRKDGSGEGPGGREREMEGRGRGKGKEGEGRGRGEEGGGKGRERQCEAAKAMGMASDSGYRSLAGRGGASAAASTSTRWGTPPDPLRDDCGARLGSGGGSGQERERAMERAMEREREREKESEEGSEGSQGEGSVDSPVGLRVPCLPSLSRLRLSSREPEDGSAVRMPHLCKLPLPCGPPPTSRTPPAYPTPPHSPPARGLQAAREQAASGGPGELLFGGSPGKLTRRMSGPASLKRKRPPMLDIPIKDAFTSSPTSTPPAFLVGDDPRDAKEVSGDGPGFAVLCKRGRRRDNMEDRYQAVQGLGGVPGLVSIHDLPLLPFLIPPSVTPSPCIFPSTPDCPLTAFLFPGLRCLDCCALSSSPPPSAELLRRVRRPRRHGSGGVWGRSSCT